MQGLCMVPRGENVPNNVHMLQLLEQRDLPDCSGGHALLLLLQPDLLQRNDFVGPSPQSLVYHAIGALPNLLYLLKLQVALSCQLAGSKSGMG